METSASCLRVFQPGGSEEDYVDYPISEGESIIGRGDDCDVTILAGSLSRQHARILVEEGSHFIMDLGSRNKTFRKMVTLKPNVYYELTNGVELTLANVTCHYVITEPSHGEGAAEETDKAAENETEEDSGGSTVCGEDVTGGAGEGEEEEQTQAYNLASPSTNQCGEDAPMDCEPTIAYDLVGAEAQEDDNDDSEQSSPPLVGASKQQPEEGSPSPGSVVREKTPPPVDKTTPPPAKTTNPYDEVTDDDATDDEATQQYSEGDLGRSGEGADEKGEQEGTEQKAPDPPTDVGPSLMDFSEQGPPDTLPLPNLEPQGQGTNIELAKSATVVLESYQSTVNEGESTLVREEDKKDPFLSVPRSTKQASAQSARSEEPMSIVEPSVVVPSTDKWSAAAKEESEPEPSETSLSGRGGARRGQRKGSKTAVRKASKSLDESPLDLSVFDVPISQSDDDVSFTNSKSGRGKRGRGKGRQTSTRKKVLISPSPDPEPIPAKEANDEEKSEESSVSSKSGRGSKRGRGKGRQASTRKAAKQLEESPDLSLSTKAPDEQPDEPMSVAEPAALKDPIPEPSEASQNGHGKRGRGKGRQASTRKAAAKSTAESSTLTPSEAGEDSKGEEELTASQSGLGRAAKSVKRGRGKGRLTMARKASKTAKVNVKEESPDLPATMPDQSDEPTVPVSPTAEPTETEKPVKKGRGKKHPATKKAASKSQSVPRTPSRRSQGGGDKPKVMFTGVTDEDGEKLVQELGGEMVDSVHQCTHLVTDKVRRTVKFLCCLSRGSVIVDGRWLEACEEAGRFVSAEPFLIKDRAAEKQYNFTLLKSHQLAKSCKLFDGYKVYLTPGIKPPREQMSDIIACAGGEAINFSSPVPPGERTLIVTCKSDLGMCSDIRDVLVCSTELVLTGVLRQVIDVDSHLMSSSEAGDSGQGRKRRAYDLAITPAAKRRK